MSNSDSSPYTESIVAVIDDEENVRNALVDHLVSLNRRAVPYVSAAEFLASVDLLTPGCILLDMKMPEISGLELQESLAGCGNRKPIVFMTGNASVTTSVKAMKAGAVDYLVKPFDSIDLIEAIDRALVRDRENRIEASIRDLAVTNAKHLTPRETEVMQFVSKGLMNKQIAYEMGISEIMVKLHRGRMMRKMEARSVADIVRKFDQIQNFQELEYKQERDTTAAATGVSKSR